MNHRSWPFPAGLPSSSSAAAANGAALGTAQGGPGGREGDAFRDLYAQQNPEEAASWLSTLLFNYCNGLIKLGQQKALQHADLWPLARVNTAAVASSRFQAALEATRDPVAAPQARVLVVMRCCALMRCAAVVRLCGARV